MRVLVVGAGVVGLTCAVRLAEDGHDVHVVARDLPGETVSGVAAGWWYPYRALPQDKVTAWAAASYRRFAELAEDPDTGVRMRDSIEVHRRAVGDPWWAPAVPTLRHRPDPAPGYADSWSFRAPVADTGHYLPWLVRRLEASGGTLTRLALSALPGHGDVVVHCSGLAARVLADDPSVHPVAGQVVRLAQPGLERVWLDSESMTYVVPRVDDVVVGGSSEVGRWDRRPDPALTREILRRARELVPALREATVLGVRVGLRPARPAVRLEMEHRAAAAPVVHCYGHGGAGVTVSWGCADEVASLVGALCAAA